MRRAFLGFLFLIAGGAVALAGVETVDTPPMTLGTRRPAIAVERFDGTKVHGWKSLEGRVVVIDFWATWCPPCIAAFPKLEALKRTFAGKPVTFLSVTYETREKVAPALQKHRINAAAIALDEDFRTYSAFNAWGIPVVYVFDPQGRLAAVVGPDDLNAAVIETVLAGKTPKVKQAWSLRDPARSEADFRAMRAGRR